MQTIGDIAKKGAKVFSEKVAAIFEETRLTYRQLNERVNRFSNALIRFGYKKGDRLLILAENSHKYLEVYFAAAKAGMSVTPLNFRLSNQELVHIAKDCEACLIIFGEGYADRALKIAKDISQIRLLIGLDETIEGCSNYEELIEGSLSDEPNVEVDENDMAILMYTGGTTGLPKGVMLSHRNILTAMIGLIITYSFTRRDKECFILPLFHISLWPVFCMLMVGGSAVILRRPDLKEILRLIESEKCTHINLVPTLLGWILTMPELDDYDLSSLRGINYAGSPMAPEVLKKCIAKFGNILTQGYGLTEAAPIVSSLFREDHTIEGPKSRLLKSVGKEGPVVEVRVVDENDRSVEPGKIGEIVARGKNIMMGYWKNPELTAKTIKDGWLHTGDMGTMDDEGYIYLVDRKADMIISGGENIYPKEVEDVLYGHWAVQECAVVSAPDEKWGERVLATIVLKSKCKTTEEEIIAYCHEKLAGYKCPKQVVFVDELPKTAVGKISRRAIKKRFLDGL